MSSSPPSSSGAARLRVRADRLGAALRERTDPLVRAIRHRWTGWTLRGRLLTGILALLAVVCLGIGALSTVYVRQFLIDQLDRQVASAATRVAGPRPTGYGAFPRGTSPWTIVLIYDSAGTPVLSAPAVLVPRGAQEAVDVPLSDQQIADLTAVPADRVGHTVTVSGLGDYRVIAQPAQVGTAPGLPPENVTLVTGLPMSQVQETVWRLILIESVLAGAGLLLAGIAGTLIVGRSLRPLRRVAATARRVAELPLATGEVDLSVRVPAADTDSRTEVGQVGAALNRMLDHVGDALAVRHASEMRVRQFVADASHELRTPLAAIRGYSELTRRGHDPVPEDVAHALSRIESESKRMTTLVDDLLLLARLDSGRPLDREPIGLSQLVVDTVNDAHAAGPDHVWRLLLPDEPVTVTGDGARLHQVLANLLANARTHTPPGTIVTTSLTVEHGWAVITVADNGPGIPQPLLPEVFERFVRGDGSRSRAAGSTGLGLSIVAAVVEAHGGQVSVESSPQGTTMRVRLPDAVLG